LLKLPASLVGQTNKPNAATLFGAVGPNDLAICLDGRMASGQSEFQTAALAFDDSTDNLAAQAPHAEV
jgi:hypothetical protein